ncbi:hypothetical protein [Vulgatibacter incomptus]|uniref:Flagellar biosynthesis protein FlgN n=1 Tax=Vulgatibacter incomptus TaxID=1391653 RepID=A0A0K1PHK9_9BACT|nr:hypothetical protein [Vulgatibacter incomptus]AKU92997.1 hypothetical protein AKJ08_3384 [Vulgatibacter incomptus]
MLEEAIATAEELRTLLRLQLDEAPESRRRLAGLDPERALEWAAEREARNGQALDLEKRILEALTRACEGLPEPTLAALRRHAPAEAARLDEGLDELRDLASRLREEDLVTREALGHSLACVRSYLSLLAPGSAAYDRRGRATGRDPLSSRSVSV